ncbi:MAG TPA: efflux transporter outer membrane subunit [Thermoanaerobaculia bacterium]|nr:efflux transporter outer membrane subunit [Thermoanaerobaculia bacterium]
MLGARGGPTENRTPKTAHHIFGVALSLLLSGCAVGPNYKRPTAPVPAAYKEAQPPAGDTAAAMAQWKPAEPRDDASRGKWWELFEDPDLNALEEQVNVSNQNIAQAEAQFRGARAAVRGARADFFPTVTASASATRSKGTTAPAATTTVYALPVDLSYEVDVWGRVRRGVEASVAGAQASAADLETVRLTMHTELALDYFELRGIDTQRQLLDANVAAYDKALQMTMNRFNQGVVSGVDVAQAQTLLETTRAQATDLGVSRAQLEHAIATLIGKAPADFTFKPAPGLAGPPVIPVTMPSELLERRPDIAAAERRAAAANAQIGVATSAFFPSLLLSATGGYQSSKLADWFSLPSRFWSIGPALVTTIFDGGKRRAGVEQAQASYDAAVAVYRLDVLTSFQQVEDNLATLRILAEEATQQAAAVTAAERSLAIARNRYLAGTTTYLEVVTAQAIALSNERTAVDIQTRRMTAAVNLIKALGGGWRASDLLYGPSLRALRDVRP